MPEANESAGTADVLSQSEVERLVAQVAAQESSPAGVDTGGETAEKPRDSIQPYDFRHPIFLSPADLRRLRIRHEEFVRALAARLSIHMRLEFSLQLSKLETVLYQKFTQSLPNPTQLALFKVEPLRGVGILDIHPRLALTLVDRLLGGPAHSITADHELSEIELALLDQSVLLIIGEWCNHWASGEELRPLLLGHETNGQFLQTAPHDTVMLVLAMEAKLGDCLEQIQVAFPCFTLEPLIRKLGRINGDDTDAVDSLPARVSWNRSFDDVPVPITAIWDSLVMTARDVANLKPGDLLPLDPRSARQVTLRLADSPKFEGHLGTTAGKWAVAISGSARKSS